MTDLALICRACNLPVEDDAGSLRVTFAAIGIAQREQAEWDASHDGQAVSITEFLLGPEDVNWLAYHDECDPERQLDAYHIDAERLRTWQDLARWTAHLMGKTWLPLTDWDDLLREAAGETPARTIRVLERQP